MFLMTKGVLCGKLACWVSFSGCSLSGSGAITHHVGLRGCGWLVGIPPGLHQGGLLGWEVWRFCRREPDRSHR